MISQAKVMSNKCHLVIPRNNFFFLTRLYCGAYGIIVSWQRIEPMFPALEAWSLNHWTAREVPLGIQRVGRQTRTHTYIKPSSQRQKTTQQNRLDEILSKMWKAGWKYWVLKEKYLRFTYLAKWSSVKRNHKDIIRHAQIFLKKVIMLLFFRQKQKQKILIKTYVQKWIKNKK